MNKEETLLRKRLTELSRQAYHKDIVTFSDFLNLNELNILHTTPKDLFPARYETFGGYEMAERQMVAFLPDALYYEYQYPMQVLKIRPANPRFAEELSHRDYLGSLMNFGVERCKMGDILLLEDCAEVFVCQNMAGYLCQELTRIRHTVVQTELVAPEEISYEPRFEEVKGTVSSIRLDSVLALAYPLSRSKMTSYIEGGRVFVNGKLITSNGYHLKEGDILSVRGLGRIRYEGMLSETKKKRCLISLRKYI